MLVDIDHRWNQDVRHKYSNAAVMSKFRDRYGWMEQKYLVRLAKLRAHQNPHEVALTRPSVIVEGVFGNRTGVHRKTQAAPRKFRRLSEEKIASALLLAYHYRFTSMDAIARKCR